MQLMMLLVIATPPCLIVPRDSLIAAASARFAIAVTGGVAMEQLCNSLFAPFATDKTHALANLAIVV
jgi:hypothetical protein